MRPWAVCPNSSLADSAAPRQLDGLRNDMEYAITTFSAQKEVLARFAAAQGPSDPRALQPPPGVGTPASDRCRAPTRPPSSSRLDAVLRKAGGGAATTAVAAPRGSS